MLSLTGAAGRKAWLCSSATSLTKRSTTGALGSCNCTRRAHKEGVAKPKPSQYGQGSGSTSSSTGTSASSTSTFNANGGGVIAETEFPWLLNAKELTSEKQSRKNGKESKKGKGKAKASSSTAAAKDDVNGSVADVDAPRAKELGPSGQAWPPLAKDVLTNMARFPSCILLTRVGGFYESYFDQAPILANMLRIKLATRVWGGRTVPMAGFPIFQLEKYLKRLVIDQRRLVAICDEFKEITSADGERRAPASSRHENPFAPAMIRAMHNEKIEIRRKVTRVVSPGTLIDEYFLDPFTSNWVMSICRTHDGKFGLAWLDVSTADFNTTVCDDAQSMRDEVARVGPIEIVLEPEEFTQHRQTTEADALTSTIEGEHQSNYALKESPLWEALDPNKVHISFCERQPVAVTPHSTDHPTAEDHAVANLTAHLRTRLLDFNIDNVKDLTGTNEGPTRRRRESVMTIDASTLSALEINTAQRRDEASFNALSNTLSIKGSLLSYVRRTVTKGGARLLAQWLTSPSTSLPLIHRRQALVALFLAQAYMMDDFRNMLRRRAGDINRALQRILTSRNDEQDLLEVRDFTKLCTDIVDQLGREISIVKRDGEPADNADGWQALSGVVDSLEDLSALGDRLGEAIDESVIDKRLQAQEDRMRETEMEVLGEAGKFSESAITAKRRRPSTTSLAGASSSQETGLWGASFEHLIRPASSEQLSVLTKEHLSLRRKAAKLEGDLRDQFGDRITLRFLLGQGYIVHVGDVHKLTSATLTEMESVMQMAYKSKSTRTYYNEQWTRIGSRLSKVEQELQEKETIELQRLRLDVLVELGRLRKNAAMMHELDVLAGFGTLASELDLVRPTVNDGDSLHIQQGRHLGVEMSLLQQHEQQQQFHAAISDISADSIGNTFSTSRPFTPNDVSMHSNSRLHLITGPNMGGKSTLLRMVAIITILAQVGSFVPAAQCTVGVVDQIFSRIGAHDAIHADRSTFMVEMLEVAQFLRRSTSRSLVLCDEVGRGTDSETGTAIAFATASQLVREIKCKCLFATHLHTVGDLLHNIEGVEFYCTDLEQTEQDEIVFSHKLRPGLNRNSHGLTIARLAGMPEDVLQRAQETVTQLQSDRAGKM